MKIKALMTMCLVMAVLAIGSTAQATFTSGLSLFNDPADAGVGTVSVSANVNYLTVNWEIDDSTDARDGENTYGNDQTSVNIGPTAAIWGNPYDIKFQTSADLPWGSTSSGTIDGWNTEWSLGGAQQASLPGDLQSTTTYNGTTRVSEWVIPLGSLGLSVGDTLILSGSVEMGNVSGNPTYVWPLGHDFNLNEPYGSTYAEITVVPEPATMCLLGIGGLMLRRRKRA